MTSRMFYIFVDDLRTIPPLDEEKYVGITCRTYDTAVDTIKICHDSKVDFVLDLDHDLGLGKTGYDICKYIVENQIPVKFVKIHSMNPVGCGNMRQLLSHYGYAVT